MVLTTWDYAEGGRGEGAVMAGSNVALDDYFEVLKRWLLTWLTVNYVILTNGNEEAENNGHCSWAIRDCQKVVKNN
jgi:hypothetical protein